MVAMEIWQVRDGVVDLLVFKGHYFDFWNGLKRAIVTACSDFYFARYFGIAMDLLPTICTVQDFFSQISSPYIHYLSYIAVLLHKRTKLIHPNFAARVLVLVSGMETDTEPSRVSPLGSAPVPAMVD